MEKNVEKVLEGEILIKKIDSEGNIYYENLQNESQPNWENFHNFLQNVPIKEFIVATVVLGIMLLVPNVCSATSKIEQEQLIKGRAFLDTARQKRVILKEAKKVVSMKKISLWNEKLIEFEPTTSILKYILHFVTAQVHSFRQEKMNRLALIEQAKQLAEQKKQINILLRVNGGFIGFNIISQIIEKGKKILKKQNGHFLLWQNINLIYWVIALLLLITLYPNGDKKDCVLYDPFLPQKRRSLHDLVFLLLKIILKKKNIIISFIKSKPILFTIGSVGIISATIIFSEQSRELKILRSIIKDGETEKEQQLNEEKKIIDVTTSKSE